MKASISITGQINGNYKLRNAITSGRLICEIKDQRFSGFIIEFGSMSDAKKALSNARTYLINEGNDPSSAKTRGDFSYSRGEFIKYDASSATIV